MICEDREESIARLEWREAKAAIRRKKEEMNLYGANIDRKAMLGLLKLRARMWRKMVPMNAAISNVLGRDYYTCPSCHAAVYKGRIIMLPSRHCKWCGQRLKWTI